MTLVERHADDPFALIGINAGDDQETFEKRAAEENVTWRNAVTDFEPDGLPMQWKVKAFPTVYVLDHEGKIRHKNLHGKKLDQAVAKLIDEARAAGAGSAPKSVPAMVIQPLPRAADTVVEAAIQDPPEEVFEEAPEAEAAPPSYEELLAEYEAAREAWYAELRATRDTDAYAEVRENNPTPAFWERFGELGAGGEGRALLWQLQNVWYAPGDESARGALVDELFGAIVAGHASAEWIGDLGRTFSTVKREGDWAAAKPRIRALIAGTTSEDVERSLSYMFAYTLGGRDASDDDLTEAKKLYGLVAQRWPDSKEGGRAGGMLFRLERLQMDMVAPELAATGLDGVEWKLSDTLGKVTLVDFWGFW